MINSFAALDSRFATIANRDHAVTRASAGAVGELFEQLMVGEIVGNQRGADFAAIDCEAKVHYGSGVVSLFTLAPTWGMKAGEFKRDHGSTVVRANAVNNKGFTVLIDAGYVCVARDGQAIVGWTVEALANRIEEKMANVCFVTATKKSNSVTFTDMFVGKRVNGQRFVDAIRTGKVAIEMRGDRGCVFRAMPAVLKSLFETTH